jgi:hypothetical protein
MRALRRHQSSVVRASDLALTPILQAITYGGHAPNPHNTQAWKIEVLSDLEGMLYIDERRLLPVTDPSTREIHIGAGCFLESLATGMAGQGYVTHVELLPRGPYGTADIGKKPVARFSLANGSDTRRALLAQYVDVRQTNRKPYSGPPLEDVEAERIRTEVAADGGNAIIVRGRDMGPILDLFRRATEIETATPRASEEMRQWFRFDERERRTKRDGLSVPQTVGGGIKGRIVELSLGNPRIWSSAFARQMIMRATAKAIDSARGIVLLTTRSNRQLEWVNTGRTYERFHLVLTQLGLTCQPYSQVLHEYPEMAPLQAELNELLGVRAPEKIQMAVRVGRARRAYRAPRRDPLDFVRAFEASRP